MSNKEKIYFLKELRDTIDKYLFLGYAPSVGSPGGDSSMRQMSEAMGKTEFQELRKKINKMKSRGKDLLDECGIEAVVQQYPPPAVGGPIIDCSILDIVTENLLWRRVRKEEILDKIDEAIGKLESDVSTDTKITKPTGESNIFNLSKLHPEICKKCKKLFKESTYTEAVEKGFKVVKDRLRDLTGYEKGSEAFGKGKLYIKGAAAQNVDSDFNEGVKFLTMAIDMFRNEKSHTSDANIDDPIRAYEYLNLSSLAMHLLDSAEIKNNHSDCAE
ncbi:MAG: TIGR02391 family protein [Elusimicrobia bacterium CG1_02_37_114]|nr:MAG: TIGR02391 family protein [Elusimicrobia bacterium CG1_02_37_114]PIZ13912.1 MAG: TIGR02391 family protein [Elusimicrobia bacterium CG_4_10_14_0_8_um_filter_37_32]